MSAITGLDDLLTVQTDGTQQHIEFFVDSRIAGNAAPTSNSGVFMSLWRFNKSNGQNPGIPTTVTACDRTTVGAMKQANASSGKQLWLISMEMNGTHGGALTLYDRLLHIGGLSGTSTSAQTVGGSITRNTGGVGNQIWIEINTQVGGTSTTLTVNYTNQAGASKTSPAVAIGNTSFREETRLIRVPLFAGDTGVQSVQSVTLAATTGVAGDFGVVIARPLATGVFDSAGSRLFRNLLLCGAAVPIPDDACLAMAWNCGGTSPARGDFGFHFVEK